MYSPYPSLKPLTFGQTIDRAVRLYRKNFFTFLGIAAVVFIPVAIMFAFIALIAGTSSDIVQAFSVLGIAASALVLLFLSPLAYLAMVHVAVPAYLGQEVGGVRDAYKSVTSRLGDIFAALILIFVMSIALFMFALIPIVGWFTGFAMLFTLSGMVAPLVYPVLMVENKSGSGAIRRSWDLVRRRFWPVYWFMVLLAFFTSILTQGPAYLVTASVAFLGEFGSSLNFSQIEAISTVVQYLFQALFFPITVCVGVVLYFDLKVRTEGFDLALQSENNLEEKRPLSQFLQEAPEPETSKLLTGENWVQFLLMSVMIFIFMAVLFTVAFSFLAAAFAF